LLERNAAHAKRAIAANVSRRCMLVVVCRSCSFLVRSASYL
jgi:hypothetical protein